MNFYDALNNGDGSIKEPHITSVFFYLLKETFKLEPQNSLIEFFFKNYLSEQNFNLSNLDPDLDIKIEEIFRNGNLRKDTDITIYLHDNNTIINLENKINLMAYDSDQIANQELVIKAKYPTAHIISFLILPCPLLIEKSTGYQMIYWVEEKLGLISIIKKYISQMTANNNIHLKLKHFLTEIDSFFDAFAETIEQQCLSIESKGVRGPRTQYPRSMREYLTEISNRWDFPNPNEVTVRDLIQKFDALVCQELLQTYGENDAIVLIEKFRRGALEAQPKIFTINEANRIHYGKVGPLDNRLFYYPDFPDGNYDCKWKDVKIAPLHKLTEPNNIYTFTNNN